MSMQGRNVLMAALAAVTILFVVAGSPAYAHRGEHHAAQTAAQPVAPAPTATSPSDMPVTDMAWPTAAPGSMAMPGGMAMDHEKPKTFQGRLLAWLGMWHPAVIHFPIALLLTVALLEAAAALRRQPAFSASARLLLAIATVGAFAAAPLGWADAGLPTPADESSLVVHRWLGTALPFLILVVWRLKRPTDQAATRPSSPVYGVLLSLAVALILVQAYFGAEITHGAGHLAF
jgi:uncharacterized membrane protein